MENNLELNFLCGKYKDCLGVVPETVYNEELVKKLALTIFGIEELKDQQLKCIEQLINGKDVFIIASTGFGKSLIFQIPPLYLGKTAIIISPLIALMHDQVISLNKRGIKTGFINSTQKDVNIYLKFYEYKIIYITPESLICNKMRFDFFIKHLDKISLFAIDEAHLIKSWATFRREYSNLHILRDSFPSIPIVALTATSPSFITNYVKSSLKLDNPLMIKSALNRRNISFQFKLVGGGNDYLKVYSNFKNLIYKELQDENINKNGGCILIYVMTRNLTYELTKYLIEKEYRCMGYNGGMNSKEREKVILMFKNKMIDVVVCTIAFGMGIDRKDVRCVYHFGIPFSIENYYQEVGRAGRDGLASKGIVFYTERCLTLNATQLFIIKKNETTTSLEKEQECEAFTKMQTFTKSMICRRKYLLEYLNDEIIKVKPECLNSCCDVCDYKAKFIEKRKLIEAQLECMRREKRKKMNEK